MTSPLSANAAPPTPTPTTITNAIRRVRNALGHTAAWFHVEHHGKYSVERLLELYTYSLTRFSTSADVRCLLLLVSTALPSLVLNSLIDVIPMGEPNASSHTSHKGFWARLFLVGFCIGLVLYDQFRRFIPALATKMTTLRIWLMAAAAAGLAILYDVVMCPIAGFPIPFVILFSAPVFMAMFSIGLLSLCWRELYADRDLRVEMARVYALTTVQLLLTIVYPAFTHFFGETQGAVQTVMAMMLPLMKLSARAAFSFALKSLNEEDMRPEVVVFNAEVFHSLFTSCCIQSSTSTATTVVLICMDAAETLLGIGSVDPLLKELRKLEAKIQKQRPLVSRSTVATRRTPFIDTALQFVLHLESHTTKSIRSGNSGKSGSRSVRLTSTRGSLATVASNESGAKIVPISELLGQQKTARSTNNHSVMSSRASKYACEDKEETLLSRLRAMIAANSSQESVRSQTACVAALTQEQQELYVSCTLQLFHVADFILLTAFAEVVVAVIYAGYLVAVFYLPNRVYYQRIAKLTEVQLWNSVGKVLLYASVDFASLLVVCITLKHKLGISPLHHLAFVVQKQWHLVQTSLIMWVLFAMSSTLQHFGYDYTFQFQWLQHANHGH